MFDPTAFDNMKVVLEGSLYDLDISGEIRVVNREDLVNLARMEREFSITFCTEKLEHKNINITYKLNSSGQELYNELLLDSEDNGCICTIIIDGDQWLNKEDLNQSSMFFQKYYPYGTESWIEEKTILRNESIENKTSLFVKPIDKITEDRIELLEDLLLATLDILKWQEKQVNKKGSLNEY